MLNFDKNWHLQPIKGDTGKAYKGEKNSEKIFIKSNSTPFLAALSREGLTPKLLWTKRTGNGDVLTAQEWLDGRQLTEEEMSNNEDVVYMLRYLHKSESLKSMLKRMDGVQKTPFDFLKEYIKGLPDVLKENETLAAIFCYLEDHLPSDSQEFYVACHGDVIHNNWMLSNDGELYLVDWDYSALADSAYDLGTILGQYVSPNDWMDWLVKYDCDEAPHLLERVRWYASMGLLLQTKRSCERQEYKQMNAYIKRLETLHE